jgi:NAD(P)H-flavin reductase
LNPAARLCIGGGVGTAVVHPIAQGLHKRGVQVTSIIGGRSKEWVIFEGTAPAGRSDGLHGRRQLRAERFCDRRRQGRAGGGGIDIVYAVGPVPMMRAVANLTKPLGVRTIVSLNPVMIDGTGMCGGCRVRGRRDEVRLRGRPGVRRPPGGFRRANGPASALPRIRAAIPGLRGGQLPLKIGPPQ